MGNTFVYYGNDLYHHGILGQKWGTRRWQNEDGSLTEEGRLHYGYGPKRTALEKAKADYRRAKVSNGNAILNSKEEVEYNNLAKSIKRKTASSKDIARYNELTRKIENNVSGYLSNKAKAKQAVKDARKEWWDSEESANVKKAIKVGAAVAATALVAYGGYKLYQNRGLIKSFSMRGKDELGIIKNKLTNGLQTPLNSIKRTARKIGNETIPNIRTAIKGTTNKVSGAAKEFIGDESNKFKAAGNLARNTVKSAGRSAASAAGNAKASADKAIAAIKNYDLKKMFTQTGGASRSNAFSALLSKIKTAGVDVSKLPKDALEKLSKKAAEGATDLQLKAALASIIREFDKVMK